MKVGFNMLLWTTVVTEGHAPILEQLKAAGYDGVEIPIFDGDPAGYAALGRLLDDLGLERTAITVIPSPDQNPISGEPAVRQRGDNYLAWCLECSAALGAKTLAGRSTSRSACSPGRRGRPRRWSGRSTSTGGSGRWPRSTA